MRSLVGTRPLKAVGLTRGVGLCAAVLAYWETGLIASVPAAVGLTVLATSDLTTHRFSLKTLGRAAALVVAGLVVDTARSSAWNRLVATVVVACIVGLSLLALWLSTGGVAFGDVLLLTFTVLVPAWLSPRAAGATVLVTLIVGGAVAMFQRHGRPADPPHATVALGPPLLAGWAVGVMVG